MVFFEKFVVVSKRRYTYIVPLFSLFLFSSQVPCLRFPVRHRSVVPSLFLYRPDGPVNRGWCRTNRFECNSKQAPRNRIRRWSCRWYSSRRRGSHPPPPESGASALDRLKTKACTHHLSWCFLFLPKNLYLSFLWLLINRIRLSQKLFSLYKEIMGGQHFLFYSNKMDHT